MATKTALAEGLGDLEGANWGEKLDFVSVVCSLALSESPVVLDMN